MASTSRPLLSRIATTLVLCAAAAWGCSSSAGEPDTGASEPLARARQGLLANGEICAASNECTSGYCVDGVCCNLICQGLCQACSASKKGTGPDGECANIKGNTDPDGECADQSAATCGTNGACSGLGTCALYPQGTACGASTCVNGVQTGQACTGAGSCASASAVPCAPYTCSGNACGTACADDSQCVPSYYCRLSDSSCQADLSLGEACTSGSQCTTGHCADGYCCDTSCTGTCVACSAASKGGGDNGVCGPVADGTDPDADCDQDAPVTCGRDGACDGSGSCRYYQAGVSCGPSTCQGNVVKGQVCNGFGTCLTDPNGTDCSPYVCQGNGCANPCATSNDCAVGYTCKQGACLPPSAVGQPCTSAADCASSYCADGVCCNSACTGQCEACDLAGQQGSCLPVRGEPKGTRLPCEGPGNCGGSCDGVQGSSCTYPSATTPCNVTCTNHVLRGGHCDGAGQCTSPVQTACAPYGCEGQDACRVSCSGPDDCATGFTCQGSACVTGQGGGGGAGGSSGAGTGGGDSPDSGVAAEPDEDSEDDGGCQISTAPAEGAAGSLALLVLLGLALRRHRA